MTWRALSISPYVKDEVSRMKRSAKQSLDKERAMLDQLNALRRARDASETRVQVRRCTLNQCSPCRKRLDYQTKRLETKT